MAGLLLALTLWEDHRFLDTEPWALHNTIGLAIIIPAYLLWATARYQLGASFTGRAEARSLVTHGLYARLRHPVYLFAELLIAGLLVFMAIPILWIVALATLPFQIVRARREDRVLEEAFGEEYRAYRRTTWF